MSRCWFHIHDYAVLGTHVNNQLGMKLELKPGGLRDITRHLDHLDRRKCCTLVNRTEGSFLILVPPAKHQVRIDVMLTSNQRHVGATRLKRGLNVSARGSQVA